MPATYGRPKAPTKPPLPSPTRSPTSTRSPSPTFNQDWKQKLVDIDNDKYNGEMVKSSSLTPLVSSSSLSAAPELPRSSPPGSPANAYRDTEMTDDPDTSVELNTAIPSSEAEQEEQQQDDTDDDEPVKRRMTKPLRVVDSDDEPQPRRLVPSTSSAMSDLGLSHVSSATTPASSVHKPIKLALTDDEQDEIEAASSPKASRSRKKGLNKAEKIEMAKTSQAIAASREIRIPNASKRIDPKAYLSSYTASLAAEIDSYPFPPGPRSDKASLRDKIASMRPLSAHAPAFKTQHPSSDPIVESSQSATPARFNDEEEREEEPTPAPEMFGKPNALGMSMFGGESSDEELPPVKSLLFPTQSKPKPKTASPDRLQALAEKKRAALAHSLVPASDSDSDIEIQSKPKPGARTLARPGQAPTPNKSKSKSKGVTDSQIVRAGHAHHFGRDALSSSPVKGGGVYDDSQWGRPTASARPSSTWGGRKTVGAATVSTAQLVRHAAASAFVDGQARQKADEDKWKKAGGRVIKRDGGGVGVEDAVKEALARSDGQDGGDEDEDDEDDDDYRGSASEEEEEEDKENLPAGGRKPHEPVSDFEGSEHDDKENSLELVGVGSPAVSGVDEARSPAHLGLSPAPLNGLSPSHLNGLSPHANGQSPRHLNGLGRSPSHPLGSHLHSRVSSSGSGRLPLSELGDDDQGESENAAVARAPLGELDVQVDEEEPVVERRPTKRARRVVLDDDEDETPRLGSRLASPSQRLLGSPSQRRLGSPSRRLGSPSQRLLASPSQRRLGSPSQRFGSPLLRFGSPQPSRLRSQPGTQSFSQMQTQDMLGGLGDVFGFESQVPAEKKDDDEGGGLTQLFANAGPVKSDGFAALRNAEVELTQDERSKLLYKPVISEEDAKRDQELFEREDELMAQPFSPTQKEQATQGWLNERGLWTQTRPSASDVPTQFETQAMTPLEFRSTPIDSTDVGTPSPSPSQNRSRSESQNRSRSPSPRRRIIRRGRPPSELADEAPPLTFIDRLMKGSRDLAAKEKKAKKKLKKSEFVEGEAAESDDEYGDFGPRVNDEEDDEDEDRHVEGLVDDQAMDEETEGADTVQAKFMEQNAEDDAQREKVAREVVAGKHRTRRRGRDNMDLDDDEEESEDESRPRSKNFLKKRKIENDGLDELEKHESTRAFVQMYNKGIKSAEDDEFAHLNQVTDDIGEPELAGEGDAEEGEDEDEDEDEGEEDRTLREPETPLGTARNYIPSSTHAEIAFEKPRITFQLDEDSDEEPAFNLPDADARKGPSFLAGQKPGTNVRAQKWAAQESGSRINYNRMGQGVSVTGHNKTKSAKPKSGGPLRPTASVASSSSSSKLGRLGSKADGFR